MEARYPKNTLFEPVICVGCGLTTLSGSNGTVQDTQHRVYKNVLWQITIEQIVLDFILL